VHSTRSSTVLHSIFWPFQLHFLSFILDLWTVVNMCTHMNWQDCTNPSSWGIIEFYSKVPILIGTDANQFPFPPLLQNHSKIHKFIFSTLTGRNIMRKGFITAGRWNVLYNSYPTLRGYISNYASPKNMLVNTQCLMSLSHRHFRGTGFGTAMAAAGGLRP